ncbi:hypothetical protein HBI75_135660 [Parastagonospora nodorum]|nr:hypothetical protein HBI75_135660 [Parastagonospora nodorum]KAH5114484.1 hypothetical protein HBH71_141120 [Parastagonospora nodorum]
MKWSTITTLSLLAGSALGAPVSSTTAGLQISDELRNQGDGSYIATRNENGELDVKFTPMAALVARDPDHVPETPPATHSGRWSVGKDEVVCDPSHSDNVADLDAANVQLAKNAPNGKNGESEGLYGWVHLNGQTSYWCNYEVNHPTYDLVINMHVALSLKCGGSAAYGYNHYVLRRGARDLVVGRTYTGNKFCEKHFYSSPKQLEERDPAPKNFTIAKSLMQQGNGLYLATFDDSGKASVEFTPAAQLPAINSTIPAINGTLTTENPTVMSIRALRKRGEVHCDRKDSMNTGDLNWANVQLANNVKGQDYKYQWGWYHHNAETSYFCVYRVWSGNFDTIIGFHRSISDNCHGDAGYGFRRHVGAVWDSDYWLAVGRTYYGDNFCDSNFHDNPGKRLSESIEPSEKPIELSRRDTVDQVAKPAELSLRDVNPMDQGDGLHRAWFDENGILQVEFTPISEILAKHPHANVPAARSTAVASGGPIICPGDFSDKVQDLDHVNVEWAKLMDAQGGNFEAANYYWMIHNEETTYACTGTKAHLSYDDIISMHTAISNTCGGAAAYGYNRLRNPPGRNVDITIGRTWRGGSICDKRFQPYEAQVARPFAPPRRSTSSDINIASDLMFQGDGFYTATVDDSGTVDVEFTPMAELPPTAELLSKARAEGLLDYIPDSTDSLHKGKTECEGRDSGSQSDLDGANIQLAHNGDGKTYSPKSWGWVHNNGETSYFCPYTRQKVSYNEVIEMHTVTSRKCGAAAYGWDHRYVVQGRSFAVGRTFHGNNFCTDTFKGWHAVRAVETPSGESASVDTPTVQVDLHADASTWDMTSAQMDQGDGLYVASLDGETGQMAVKFTPITKLSSRASLADASSWDMTSAQMDQGDGLYVASFDDETGQMSVKFTPVAELSSSVSRASVSSNSAADAINALNKRQGDKTSCARGSSKNVADLDSANRQLAEAGSKTDLKYNRVGWVHINHETSYWCATKGPYNWRYPYDYFINQQTIVSNTCGGTAGYGWNTFEGYTVAPPLATDTKADWTKISVGRTVRGTSICTQKFIPPAAAATVESSDILSKRDSVKQTCRGGFSMNVSDLDYVNSEMAKYGDQLNLKRSPITWLHKSGETSYWCLSEGADGWTENYDYFINEQMKISSHCGGSAAYGWSHSRGYKKFGVWNVWTEFSVGRTFKGGSICRKGFVPPSAPASIEASPIAVAPRSATFDARNQGDGFYLETFNDAGESTIKFTPRAEFKPYDPAQTTVSENLTAESIDALRIRYHHPTCRKYPPTKSGSWQDVDEANVQLGRQSNGVHFDARTRGWVTINKEIAYLCAWSAWEGTYDEVIAANVLISFDCGGSTGYGWDYENKKDLTIGRTWLGDHICKINTRCDEPVQDQSVAAHAVEPMRVRSDLLQQGDGLYYGTINEAGEKTVEFTPIAELAALLPAQSATAENVTATTRDTFPPNVKYTKYWCRGYSENTPDLDFANVALAAMWDNMYLGWHNYVSFVKGKELSYICGYGGGTHTQSEILDAQIRLSAHCDGGSQRYGWEAINGLSVGRTWHGDHFCV